jgi:selenocysteine lyase/cysteine desulfurase
VASSFGRGFIKAGDEIIISHMEHHSNIVPWQMLCEERGATLKVIPITDEGDIIWKNTKSCFRTEPSWLPLCTFPTASARSTP